MKYKSEKPEDVFDAQIDNDKALALIRSALSPALKERFDSAEYAGELWEELAKLFGKTDTPTLHTALDSFFQFRFDSRNAISSLQDYENRWSRLTTLKLTLNQLKAWCLLRHLPEAFESVKVSVTLDIKEPTFKTIRDAVIAVDTKSIAYETANFARVAITKNRCNYCERPHGGECWLKRAVNKVLPDGDAENRWRQYNQELIQTKSKKKESVKYANTGEYEKVERAYTARIEDSRTKDPILDTAASVHISPDKLHF